VNDSVNNTFLSPKDVNKNKKNDYNMRSYSPSSSDSNSKDPNSKDPKKEKKITYGMPLKEIITTVLCSWFFALLGIVSIFIGWCRDGILTYYPKIFINTLGFGPESLEFHLTSSGFFSYFFFLFLFFYFYFFFFFIKNI
jgi:hypothetical protein